MEILLGVFIGAAVGGAAMFFLVRDYKDAGIKFIPKVKKFKNIKK